jgi:hypothetical protein
MSLAPISRPQLRIIDGGGKPTPKWRNFPKSLVARSPFDREEVAHFRLAQQDIEKAAKHGRRQPILDCWSCVVGLPPPVPNISSVGSALRTVSLLSLRDAHACFRGVKRPVGDDDTGWDMVVYISKPQWFFEFEPSLACIAKLTKAPDDLVFATCVRLDNPRGESYEEGTKKRAPARGVITHWEFVEADPSDKNLPCGHKERFRRRLW